MPASAPTAPAPGALPRLRRVRDHIDLNYASELDVEALAAVAAMSRAHFLRSFKAAYAETPMRYLTRRRMERAQDLLRGANLTVTEVCMAVGFSSLGSFSAQFTRMVGVGPAEYRARWAARGQPHVPGCWLFMRGVLDARGTAGPGTEHSERSADAGPALR